MNAMLKKNTDERLSLEEVKEHPWFNGEVATQEEVIEEMIKRK